MNKPKPINRDGAGRLISSTGRDVGHDLTLRSAYVYIRLTSAWAQTDIGDPAYPGLTAKMRAVGATYDPRHVHDPRVGLVWHADNGRLIDAAL